MSNESDAWLRSSTVHLLVGPRPAAQGRGPTTHAQMQSALGLIEAHAGLRPVKTIGSSPKSAQAPASQVYAYQMPEDMALGLSQMLGAPVLVEEDCLLSQSAAEFGGRSARERSERTETPLTIRVVGKAGVPVSGVRVRMQGHDFLQEGVTDGAGVVTLMAYDIDVGRRIKWIHVLPSRAYWDRFLSDVTMPPDGEIVVDLEALSEPTDMDWGRDVMGLDRVPGEFRGRGAKIAVIDGGVDATHPHLAHVTVGHDFTPDDDVWTDDPEGHGTHVAGVITGDASGSGALRGFAPEADVIVMKVFPGGRFSNLIEALDKCVELGVDVVNLSLGAAQSSELVQAALEQAVRSGIAVIAAAGNTGAAVQFPARSPFVLAVSALGRIGAAPEDSFDASLIIPGPEREDGLFMSTLTSHGPEIAVTGPGIGIVSIAPGGAVAVKTGTSMAAAHVTGMAALLVAHHPDFRDLPKGRQRVAHLYAVIKASAEPLNLERSRVGTGLPVLHNLAMQFNAPYEGPMVSVGPVAGP